MTHNRRYYRDNSIKCVVIGDGNVGKTSLLMSYALQRFPSEYVPTVFDNYAVNVNIGGEEYTLGLFDTAGQEEYGALRILSYPQTDIFLICYSIIYPHSFENVKYKWIPEIQQHCDRVPYIIVGTKEDCRYDEIVLEDMLKKNIKPLRPEEGEKLARETKAMKYVECSALTQKGLKNVFDEAILAVLNGPPKRKSSKCHLL